LHAEGQEFDPPHLHQLVRKEGQKEFRESKKPLTKNGLIAQVVRAHA
jgi:hypothetical protein